MQPSKPFTNYQIFVTARNASSTFLRIATVLAQRGFAIEFFDCSQTRTRRTQKMSLIVRGKPDMDSQIVQQIAKLVDVEKVKTRKMEQISF